MDFAMLLLDILTAIFSIGVIIYLVKLRRESK